MVQMVYMRFEEPRFDEEMHEDLIERLKESVANKVVTPKSALNEKYGEIVNNGDPRKLPFDQDYLEKISYDRVMEIYQERFTDASDFIFYIVGDVSKEVLRPLVEKYLGSIRDLDRQESWVAHADYYPSGKHEYAIKIPMEQPKSNSFS